MNTEKKVSDITDAQKQQLQQTNLTTGQNAWAFIKGEPEGDQYWIAVGILTCVNWGTT